MKNYNKHSRKVIFINIIIVFAIFSYGGYRLYQTVTNHNKEEDRLSREYCLLLLEDSVNSIVLSTYYPKGWRGSQDIQNVKLESGENYTIKIRKNLTSKDIYFGKIVKKGVVLQKNAGSDILTVISGNKQYKYLIFGHE